LPAFRDLSTWTAWLAFLAATYGLPLDPDGLEVFRQHTGRSEYNPPPGGWSEVVCIVGCQSGKSRIAATIADFEALTAPPSEDGTAVYALLVAQDHRGAMRTLFSYASSPFDRLTMLRQTVRGRTSSTLSLDSGITLAAYPCRPAAVRGLRARVAICDELAHFRTSENIPVDVEMLRVLRSRLATTGGKLIILSSPYAAAGALFNLHHRHYGRDDATTLVWQATAPEMNPTLPADYLARMEQDDPEGYRSEVLGEFRAGIAAFFDPEAIRACVVEDRREVPPAGGVRYQAFCDPSGGRADAFSLAIGHEKDGRYVLDCLRAWPAPFNPPSVVAECAAVLRSYRLTACEGDRYSAEWIPAAFRSHGVGYRPTERDRSTIYLEALPVVNAGLVELLDDPVLIRELNGLERRRGFAGRDRVDHQRGQHDDRANVACGVLAALHSGVGREIRVGRLNF